MSYKVDPEKIRQFCAEAFLTVHLRPEYSFRIADNLLQAELRGVRSHGLVQIKNYLKQITEGKINRSPKISILRESDALLVIDGDNGPGSVTGTWAMEGCIEKAKLSGAAIATVKNGTHFGMAAYYAMMALKQDMIGIAACTSPRLVSVYGGRSRELGTNPFCMAVPAGSSYPVVYDGATSEAAFNKIFFALREGRKIPASWAVDSDGNNTTDPAAAIGGTLLPFGSYKGSDISVLIYILCGLLSGAAVSENSVNGKILEFPDRVGFSFCAIDVRQIQELQIFKESVDCMIERLKTSPIKVSSEKIYMPGEKEFLVKEKSLKCGMELGEGVWNDLKSVQGEYGVNISLEECLL